MLQFPFGIDKFKHESNTEINNAQQVLRYIIHIHVHLHRYIYVILAEGSFKQVQSVAIISNMLEEVVYINNFVRPGECTLWILLRIYNV